MTRRKSPRRGYTMVEALISAGLLGLVALGVAQIIAWQGTSLRYQRVAQTRDRLVNMIVTASRSPRSLCKALDETRTQGLFAGASTGDAAAAYNRWLRVCVTGVPLESTAGNGLDACFADALLPQPLMLFADTEASVAEAITGNLGVNPVNGTAPGGGIWFDSRGRRCFTNDGECMFEVGAGFRPTCPADSAGNRCAVGPDFKPATSITVYVSLTIRPNANIEGGARLMGFTNDTTAIPVATWEIASACPYLTTGAAAPTPTAQCPPCKLGQFMASIDTNLCPVCGDIDVDCTKIPGQVVTGLQMTNTADNRPLLKATCACQVGTTYTDGNCIDCNRIPGWTPEPKCIIWPAYGMGSPACRDDEEMTGFHVVTNYFTADPEIIPLCATSKRNSQRQIVTYHAVENITVPNEPATCGYGGFTPGGAAYVPEAIWKGKSFLGGGMQWAMEVGQDLGDTGSCYSYSLEQAANPTGGASYGGSEPFINCVSKDYDGTPFCKTPGSGNNYNVFSDNTAESWWLWAESTGAVGYKNLWATTGTYSGQWYYDRISNCAVCEEDGPVFVFHDKRDWMASKPLKCPNDMDWKELWHGFSFAGEWGKPGMGSGQHLGSTGSCLPILRNDINLKCIASGMCSRYDSFKGEGQRALYYLDASGSDATRCVVCKRIYSDL